MGFGEGANELALQRRKLCLVGAEMHVGGEVPDKRQVSDDVKDDVDDLHVTLRPLPNATRERG